MNWLWVHYATQCRELDCSNYSDYAYFDAVTECVGKWQGLLQG